MSFIYPIVVLVILAVLVVLKNRWQERIEKRRNERILKNGLNALLVETR